MVYYKYSAYQRDDSSSTAPRMSKGKRRILTMSQTIEDIMRGLEAHPFLKLTGHDIISSNFDSDYNFLFDPYDQENARNYPYIWNLMNEMTDEVSRMIVPKEQAQATLSEIIEDLQTAFYNRNIPRRQWQCFGSYWNGLGCESSDFDLYYPLRDHEKKTVPKRIEKALKSFELFDNVHFMESARIPFIRLVHTDTDKQVDIAFSEIGVSSTKLMKLFITMNENVKTLTLYLKHILEEYELHGQGKITTTILFWLVVYFMQQKNLLPSVRDVRRGAERKHYVDGWDCRVPDEFYYHLNDPGNVYLLLRDFFKFYRDFDFLKFVICPFTGRSYHISDFKNLEIPEEEFSIYVTKLQNGKVKCFSTHLINLQHPTFLGNNLARQVQESVVNQFKILCFYAYKRLPDYYEIIPKMPLLSYLPFRLPRLNRRPLNLKQFTFLCFGYRKMAEKNNSLREYGDLYILSVIRKLMESGFGFKVQNIIAMEDDQMGESTTSVTFFEYRADSNTWRNFNTSRIFALNKKPSNVRLYHQPMCVHIVCEICEEKEEIKIWLQSEVHLNNFFNEYLKQMLVYMLKESTV